MLLRLRSSRPEETTALGRALAALLVPGDVVVLTGPLGAGKTRLVQGIAEGLEVPGRVTSPTFVLVRRHAGRLPLVHVDAYRLSEAHDLFGLDDDVLADDVVTCIEWGGNVEDALPHDRLDCDLEVDDTDADTSRIIALEAHGSSWTGRLAHFTSGTTHSAPSGVAAAPEGDA